jgi:hypothetical protein
MKSTKEKQMYGLDYKRLERITRTVKPYRGTTNRFPVGDRKHNTKNFYVREENGVKVFDVVYGTRFKSRSITKEEFLEKQAQGQRHVHHYTHDNTYIEYEHVPNVMGTSHPEGYFQFMSDTNYGQGDRAFLSDHSNGWFMNDSRRGGMVWTQGRGSKFKIIPIFEGARFWTGERERPHLLDDYVVVGKKVNRKVGKDVLSGYESFFKTADTMCKAISREVFLATAEEVLKEVEGREYFETAEALQAQAPLDAMILYAVALDVGRIEMQVRHPNWYQSEPHDIFNNLKRKLNNQIYLAHPEVFTPVRYGKGEVYPPSIWGYEIEVNGEVKQQY